MTAKPVILVVDDEKNAREGLARALQRSYEIVLAENGQRALDILRARTVDVMLSDVRMPGMDGLEVARRLAAQSAPPLIAFCTAFDEHALSAFESAALDYLVKPVRPDRLSETLRRARARLGSSPGAPGAPSARMHLCARLGGQLRLIPVADVRYLQAEEKYVVVHHARGEDLIEESLKSLEDEFGDHFVRIHRNCLVARQELVELRRGTDGHVMAMLRSGGTPLEVSRRCVPQLRQTLRHL